jgi:hypothetical protein
MDPDSVSVSSVGGVLALSLKPSSPAEFLIGYYSNLLIDFRLISLVEESFGRVLIEFLLRFHRMDDYRVEIISFRLAKSACAAWARSKWRPFCASLAHKSVWSWPDPSNPHLPIIR